MSASLCVSFWYMHCLWTVYGFNKKQISPNDKLHGVYHISV